jgi:hypothetical protein
VIGLGIVEIHRLLYQPHPEHPGVEAEIACSISGDPNLVKSAHSASFSEHDCFSIDLDAPILLRNNLSPTLS